MCASVKEGDKAREVTHLLGSYALQIYTLNLLIQNWQRQISKNKITTETVSFK